MLTYDIIVVFTHYLLLIYHLSRVAADRFSDCKQTDNDKMFKKKEVDIKGQVESKYLRVRDAFQQNFRSGEEMSAQLCVVHGDKVIIDLWGSVSDPGYDGDSLQTIWSSTKNLTALGVAMLVDRGLLDYRDKVTKHWPEFDDGRQQGKGEAWRE